MSELEKFAQQGEGGRGGYPGHCPRYPAPDNVQVGKICFVGGGYPGQCPRYPAPGLNLPLKHWYTLTLLITGFWLWLAFIFFPQDGRPRIHGQTNISAADKQIGCVVVCGFGLSNPNHVARNQTFRAGSTTSGTQT